MNELQWERAYTLEQQQAQRDLEAQPRQCPGRGTDGSPCYGVDGFCDWHRQTPEEEDMMTTINLDEFIPNPDFYIPTTEAILVEARRYLADETRWCRHAAARDASGNVVKPQDTTARRWCLDGAVALAHTLLTGVKALHPDDMDDPDQHDRYKSAWVPYCQARIRLTQEAVRLGYERIPAANDNLGHAGVLGMIDRALEAERAAAA